MTNKELNYFFIPQNKQDYKFILYCFLAIVFLSLPLLYFNLFNSDSYFLLDLDLRQHKSFSFFYASEGTIGDGRFLMHFFGIVLLSIQKSTLIAPFFWGLLFRFQIVYCIWVLYNYFDFKITLFSSLFAFLVFAYPPFVEILEFVPLTHVLAISFLFPIVLYSCLIFFHSNQIKSMDMP